MRRSNPSAGLIVGVLVTALAVAGAGALYALLRAALLHPFSEPETGDLVVLHAVTTRDPGRLLPPSLPDLTDIRERTHTLEDLAAWYEQTLAFRTPTGVMPIRVGIASPSLFRVLRTRMARGPGFTDDVSGAVVVTSAFWRRHFPGRRDVEGESIVLNDRSREIVGVLPPEFHLPGSAMDAWIILPIITTAGQRSARAYTKAIGRLREGVSLESGRLDIERIARALESEHPRTNQYWRVDVQRFDEYLLGTSRQTIVVFFWMAVLVLVLATVTLSNLLVVRALRRSSAIAVRLVLGAPPLRMLLGAVVTSSTIAAATAAVALPLAASGTLLVINTADPGSIFRLAQPATAAQASLLACLIVLVAPSAAIVAFTRQMVQRPPLAAHALHDLQGLSTRLTRVGLTLQIAATFCLFAASAIVVSSWIELRSAQLGFQPDNVLTTQISLPPSQWSSPELRLRRFRELVDSARAVPGVQAATLASVIPFANSLLDFTVDISPAGLSAASPLTASYRAVEAGYFSLLGSRILFGRPFMPADDNTTTPVMIVNQAFVSRWPQSDSLLGQVVSMEYTSTEQRTIVGIVENILTTDHLDPQPTVYIPLGQTSYVFGELTLAARVDPATFDAAGYSSRLNRLMQEFPVHEVRTINSLRRDSLGRHRILSLSAMTLAGVALLMATVGIIGQLRLRFTREAKAFAIRSALGASMARLVAEALRPVLPLFVLGVATGTTAIVISERAMIFGGWFRFIDSRIAVLVGLTGVAFSTVPGCLVPLRALRTVALMDRLRSL